MQFKGLDEVDMAIIDTMLTVEDPVNIKELSNIIGWSYKTTREHFRAQVEAGLHRKVINTGGRYTKNLNYGVVRLLMQIREHPSYELPPPDPKTGSSGIVLSEMTGAGSEDYGMLSIDPE